jgi:hypothetical protein
VAIVLAFVGPRWEEAVAVLIDSVDLDDQSMIIERTASESGGRRDVREDMKTRAAVRTAMIPDIAMPAVRPSMEFGPPGGPVADGTGIEPDALSLLSCTSPRSGPRSYRASGWPLVL